MSNVIYDTSTNGTANIIWIYFEGPALVKYLTRVLSPLFIPSTDHGCGVHVSTVVVTAGAGGLINHWDGHLSQNRV